jgi:Ferredoxin thioredoxin reductase catalytic beta chain.
LGKYILNPDEKIVEKIRKGLEKKNGHCPCVLEESEDTICPCREMRENNRCCCKLYITD